MIFWGEQSEKLEIHIILSFKYYTIWVQVKVTIFTRHMAQTTSVFWTHLLIYKRTHVMALLKEFNEIL